MTLKLEEMEQDLILACKLWYGDNGVEKVIGHYCNYDPEHCDIRAKYYFISELIIKLIKNGNIRLEYLFSNLSPRNIDGFAAMDEKCDTNTKIYNRMVSMICDLQIRETDKDGNHIDLIELHEANEKFFTIRKCTSCGKDCYDKKYPVVVFENKDNCICEECSIDWEEVRGIVRKRSDLEYA